MPQISIVIPNLNGAHYLETCLPSLARQELKPAEILVVDNASADNSLEVVRKLAPEATVLAQLKNLGFAAAANAGARAATGAWIAILNNDTEAAPDWLAQCASAIERHPDASFLACRVLDFAARDRLYSAGDCFLRAGIGFRRGQGLPDREEYRREVEIFSACGCAAVYRKDLFEKAGGYDEDFFAYLEDIDLALRLRARGYRGYYAAGARVFHHGGGTSGGEFSPLSVRLRTRNSLLLLIKCFPARFLWRCSPMIVALQLSWLARAVAHRRLLSYVRGLAGIIPRLPAALFRRRRLMTQMRASADEVWRAIIRSENMARQDFSPPADPPKSAFLRWYFRAF